MILKPAQPSEHHTLVALVNLAYRGDETIISWATEARDIAGPRLTLDSLAADLASSPHAHFLTAREEDDAPILGTVWLEPSTADTWYLGLLTVDPRLQNAGLGRLLLADAEAFAQSHGAQHIRITVVNTRDTLLAWYERRGYVRTGETKPYAADHMTGRPKHEGIHFLVLEKNLSRLEAHHPALPSKSW